MKRKNYMMKNFTLSPHLNSNLFSPYINSLAFSLSIYSRFSGKHFVSTLLLKYVQKNLFTSRDLSACTNIYDYYKTLLEILKSSKHRRSSWFLASKKNESYYMKELHGMLNVLLLFEFHYKVCNFMD